MNLRRLFGAEVIGGHHPAQRRNERALRIGQKGRDARECLILFGVEDMEDGADEKRMTGLFPVRSEEHTSELQSLMRISYAVFCLKKKNYTQYSAVHIYHQFDSVH